MNSTDTWTPADVSSVINIVMTFIVLLINVHQSYSYRHFHSECWGCVVDNTKDTEAPN